MRLNVESCESFDSDASKWGGVKSNTRVQMCRVIPCRGLPTYRGSASWDDTSPEEADATFLDLSARGRSAITDPRTSVPILHTLLQQPISTTSLPNDNLSVSVGLQSFFYFFKTFNLHPI